MGKRFRAGPYAEKEKFLIGDGGKIPWLGVPALEAPLQPTSLKHISRNSVVDNYRIAPSRQLSSIAPSTDLRNRMTAELAAQSTGVSGQVSGLRDLIPAAMTSKMWWIKTKDVVKWGAPGGPSAGVPGNTTGEQPQEETFKGMAPMRNLVR
eukprot:697364-Amphidinium_carterae.1